MYVKLWLTERDQTLCETCDRVMRLYQVAYRDKLKLPYCARCAERLLAEHIRRIEANILTLEGTE